MQKAQKAELSALMDGETIDNDTVSVLCQDADLQQTWQRYHLIRDTLQEETTVQLGADFTERMALVIDELEAPTHVESLENQPAPSQVSKTIWQKLKPAVMPLMQFGVAASVCLVAVFGVQHYTQQNTLPDAPVLQTQPFNDQVQDVSYNVPHQVQVTPAQVQAKNQRLGELMENYQHQRRLHATQVPLPSTVKQP